jgi:hypothetical protein
MERKNMSSISLIKLDTKKSEKKTKKNLTKEQPEKKN